MLEMLDRIADQVLDMDPCELAEILPEIQQRMDCCDHSREWERSVIGFFVINAVRFKSNMASKCREQQAMASEQGQRPRLQVVK